MRRRSLPLFVATILILGTGALVEGQQPPAQPLNAQALRAREAECEARLQVVYRQRSEGVGKVYPSAEAKAAEWQQLETALQAERTCLTETDEALVKALTAQEAECQKLAGRRPSGSNDDSGDAARCAAEVRRERAARQQVKGFRARQYTCEAQVAKFDEALRARVTPPPPPPMAPRRHRTVPIAIRQPSGGPWSRGGSEAWSALNRPRRSWGTSRDRRGRHPSPPLPRRRSSRTPPPCSS